MAAELEKSGYKVEALIDRSALEITSALFAHEYRIVHIAAHGSYNVEHPERSGVVLAKDMFLTAIEFGQLRVVPELVFLNCCHLGKVDQAPPACNKLAASVAQELINIGVRAVVVAGWAVDDAAGRDFAIQFYRQMLVEKGQFGEAVRYRAGTSTRTTIRSIAGAPSSATVCLRSCWAASRSSRLVARSRR